MKIYIQIGANIGGDSFQTIISNLLEPSRVFLVEPNLSVTESLAKNYHELGNKHEIIILPYAISPNSGSLEFYVHPINEQSSLIKRRTLNLGGIVIKNVNVLTFDDFCRRYNIVDIECLFIDAEGMDYEILSSIDMSRVNIRTIYFEKWDHENDDTNDKYRTGTLFFNEVIQPKFKDYQWETINHGQDYKLTKPT